MSDRPLSHDMDLLSILGHDYKPCTLGEPLSAYIRQESNGPFLRPLCSIWRRLGSPHLQTLEAFNTSVHASTDDADIVTLATLSLQQEFTVASFLRHSYDTNEAFTALQPFTMFASQLDLYSKIKTELLTLENDSSADQRNASYQDICQATINDFARRRDLTCGRTENKHDRCLGRLIWGEAYDWPLSALTYSFIGFLSKDKDANAPNEALFSIAPSSSSSDQASSSNVFTPATSLADSQKLSPSSELESAMHVSHIDPSSLAQFNNIAQAHDGLSNPTATPISQSRRPTWTDFWGTNMIAQFLEENTVALAPQQESPQDQEVWTLLKQQEQEGISPRGTTLSTSASDSDVFQLASIYDLTPEMFNVGQQKQYIGSPALPSSAAISDASSSSPARPCLNRSRSSSNSTRMQASNERSQRHYLKAKAQRTLLIDICARFNNLTYELQTSPRLHNTRVAQSLIAARSLSSSREHLASLPMRASLTDNGPNARKRESKNRKRNQDLQNAELLIAYASAVAHVPFPHLLDRMAFIKSNDATVVSAAERTEISPDDTALDRLIQIWLEFEQNWTEILDGVKRLSKSDASTLDQPVEMAIRLLRAASSL